MEYNRIFNMHYVYYIHPLPLPGVSTITKNFNIHIKVLSLSQACILQYGLQCFLLPPEIETVLLNMLHKTEGSKI